MDFIRKISAFLAARTSLFIIAVSVVSFLDPQLFAWVKGDIQTAILGVIMLTMGMTLSPEDYKILAKRPLDIFIGACAQYTLMPLLAWSISRALHLPPEIAVGLILVGCCPGGVSSNIMSFLCKGDVAFSVGMTTASTLLAPIMTPILVLWLAGKTIDVNAHAMFKSILIVTILPVTLGSIANLIFGKTARYREICGMMPGIAVIGLACIVGGVISPNTERIFKTGSIIFLAIFLHNTLGYILGYLAGVITRMSPAKRKTISIEVGMQNAGLATNLATKHFPTTPDVAIVSAVSCVWHSITGALLAGIFLKADAILEKRRARNRG